MQVLNDRARQLKKDIPALFFALKSSETPMIAKIFAGIAVIYALSPIDLIPDFIPILGYVDDVILLPALISLTIKLVPKETFERCRKEAEIMETTGALKKWYYAVPILFIWILLLWTIIKAM